MSSGESLPENETVERAIARVLEVERFARVAIADARREGAEMNERARATTRAIAERTERRIGRVRARFEQRIAAEVAALETAAAALDTRYEPNAADRACLGRAVATLAAELTGGGT
jgi:hypothetical protein